MKKELVALTILAAPALAFAAPTVTFEGEVTDQTCEATINGATDSMVLLPTVPSSELTGANATTGETPFTIQITNCAAPDADLAIGTKFLGHNVTAGGNLGNQVTTGGAANVAIQLLNAAGGAPIVLQAGPTTVPGLILQTDLTSASHEFAARYISEAGNATAGSVRAVAEYTLSYF